MGLVFEEDKARGQVVVADFVQGSQAEQLSKVSFSCSALSRRLSRGMEICHAPHSVHCLLAVFHTCNALVLLLKKGSIHHP